MVSPKNKNNKKSSYNHNYFACQKFNKTQKSPLIKAQLDGQPEGTIVVAERSAHGHQFRLQCILPEDVQGQKRWAVLTEEFKARFHI